MKDYGRRIRRARTVRKLTQAQLALCLGVHRSAVAQWEQHMGTMPNVVNLEKIAESLEISFEWLATGRGQMLLGPAYDSRERVPSEFARDEMEERMLQASRQLNAHKREAVITLMEALAR
jgi:transcriptional regulator with XRE-family HTH domain